MDDPLRSKRMKRLYTSSKLFFSYYGHLLMTSHNIIVSQHFYSCVTSFVDDPSRFSCVCVFNSQLKHCFVNFYYIAASVANTKQLSSIFLISFITSSSNYEQQVWTGLSYS